MVSVRKANKEDIAEITEFFSRMYRLNSEFDPLLSIPDNLEEIVKKNVEKSLGNENEIIVVAEDKNKIVGAARVIIYNRLYYKPDQEAIIEEFYVYPAYRRQGIGQYIIKYIEKELSEKGIYLLSANFPSRNLIAASFYKKMGFRDIYSKYIRKIEKSS
ncbi:GNAT family N-acetyltransferase [Acidianus sulfidivorans JP7]|uniref:N-acetyltransferase n=1 Tax=Acidianus sulfidivorans JP7 TaxID=619593 RepID=A0A2U9ILJ8_9CREN|nr:GNAT family N-acetyltransferase [Acidianus sulfidivorans]AWR96896.1 GNAT family N-acetyltransferase [Acidianus sulfidivorans JP7]